MVVMELEQRMPEAAKAASGEGDENVTFEVRTSDMERIVLHNELPGEPAFRVQTTDRRRK
eukprot:13136400-Heterocapsa_arctica.AAC.1